jgi:hypothetical protein
VQQSSFIRAGLYKSPLRVVAGILLRSRDTQAKKAAEKSDQIRELKRVAQQQRQEIETLAEECDRGKLRIAHLEADNLTLRKQPHVLPHDPPLLGHAFGPKMMALCINLARRTGLRASVDCLQIVMEWLEVDDARLPVWTTVRTWTMRVGVAAIEEPVEEADDWIWMADHSNQIGQEKALVILGMRASKMPAAGKAISHEDVRVLAVEPGECWKRDDMARVYEKLAKKAGLPMAVLIDGAVELREGAETLQKQRPEMLILRDFKHLAANVLKKIVGGDERFAEFTSTVGQTRLAVQQTELAHFNPPPVGRKARFMNLTSTMKWAAMVLWQLCHPDSVGRQGITEERLRTKLGWLSAFAEDIARWNACQSVVNVSLTFINTQGLFRGAALELAKQLLRLRTCSAAEEVADRLVEFVLQSELRLPPGQRLPLSTEILESSFGLFKQLEGQHSRGGFTSLLAGFGAILQPATAESVRESLARVSTQQMRAWVSKNLKTTVASIRRAACREFQNAA